MKTGICISKVWFDDDVIELRIGVSDGTSFFSNHVYVGYPNLADAISSLSVLQEQVPDGLLDIRFGGLWPRRGLLGDRGSRGGLIQLRQLLQKSHPF